jgi:hypothetical protein
LILSSHFSNGIFSKPLKAIFIFGLLVIACSAFAQQGNVVIIQDTSITRVLNMYQTFEKEKRQTNGYRIQLATNNNRQALMDMKAKFLQQFPDVNAYLEYQAPQFKLRVGDFRNRGEADEFVNDVRIAFSSAFVVPDKIIVQGVEW